MALLDQTVEPAVRKPQNCECGCGKPAPISDQTDRKRGYVKGQPRRFVAGHGSRVQPVENLIGKKFSKLTVLRMAGRDPIVWECSCDCGGVAPCVSSHSLKSGNTKSCGCLQREKAGSIKRLQPYEALYKRFKDCVRRHGRRRGLSSVPVALTYDDFFQFTSVTECHYCGSEVSWSEYNTNVNGAAYNLDRKDNTKGYETGNVVVCCKRCNFGKADRFTYEEWIKMTSCFRFSRKNPTSLERALMLATEAHAGQIDEDGHPHVQHCIAVMINVQKEVYENCPEGISVEELLTAAVLHDTVEDTFVTLDFIEQVYGKNVRELVDCMTRRGLSKGETKEFYRDFIYRTKANAGARILKTADLIHNSGRAHLIKSASWRKKLEYKYKIALSVLNDIDEPTWEMASWESKTDGPFTLYFVADPNGKQIEITEDEFRVMRDEMKQKRLESLSRLTASNIPETMTE